MFTKLSDASKALTFSVLVVLMALEKARALGVLGMTSGLRSIGATEKEDFG